MSPSCLSTRAGGVSESAHRIDAIPHVDRTSCVTHHHALIRTRLPEIRMPPQTPSESWSYTSCSSSGRGLRPSYSSCLHVTAGAVHHDDSREDGGSAGGSKIPGPASCFIEMKTVSLLSPDPPSPDSAPDSRRDCSGYSRSGPSLLPCLLLLRRVVPSLLPSLP